MRTRPRMDPFCSGCLNLINSSPKDSQARTPTDELTRSSSQPPAGLPGRPGRGESREPVAPQVTAMTVFRKAAKPSALLATVAVVVFCGFVASITIISSMRDYLNEYELVQIGVGPEEENDAVVAAALGEPLSNATNGITPEMKAAADDATKKTAEAVAAEIDAALSKGVDAGKGMWHGKIPRIHYG
jgi:hypothetical protein